MHVCVSFMYDLCKSCMCVIRVCVDVFVRACVKFAYVCVMHRCVSVCIIRICV